jgi:hypothetical protein
MPACSATNVTDALTDDGALREFRFGRRADSPIYYHYPVATMPR